MATNNYCFITRLEGITPSGKAYITEGCFLARSQCIVCHFENAEELQKEGKLIYRNNGLLAPWWMCKEFGYNVKSYPIEEIKEKYDLEEGWLGEESIDEYCARMSAYYREQKKKEYAAMRARKAQYKARREALAKQRAAYES